MTYADVIKAIEQEVPIERIKQWHKGDYYYVTVRCPDTKRFNELSERFNHIILEDKEPTESILITRRA